MKTILLQLQESATTDLQALTLLMDYLRANSHQEGFINQAIDELEKAIQENQRLRVALKDKLTYIISQHEYYHLFVQYSFLEEPGFLKGIWNRLFYKLLPPVYTTNDIQNSIATISVPKKDLAWLKQIRKEQLIAIIQLLDIEVETETIQYTLTQAISALAVKIGAFGMDRMVVEKYDQLQLEQGYFHTLQKYSTDPKQYKAILPLLDKIEATVNSLRLRKNEIGTTLSLTYTTRKVLIQIHRLRRLVNLADNFYNLDQWLDLIYDNIYYQAKKDKLLPFINGHLDLLALEIVEHTAKKGENYIADNKKAYFKFLRASLIGGFIIAFFACFKIFLNDVEASPFIQALLFSLNYAACFVLVKSVGGIIATKQPAMTASAIVKGIDGNDDLVIDSVEDAVSLIKQVSSSQFISFVGNLGMAFPMAILLNYLLTTVVGMDFISDYYAGKIVEDLRPIQGGAMWYAAIAGFFLSLSGLIAGYFDNKVLANQLPQRIRKNRRLQRWFSAKTVTKIADYIDHKLGTLSGNISLGFFLGLSGYIGYLTNLPIDIRHIAFSSANFGFVFNPYEMSYATMAIGFASIAIIGLVNFCVSFGLTYFIALKSRQINFSISKQLLKALFKDLILKPLSFLFYFPKKETN